MSRPAARTSAGLSRFRASLFLCYVLVPRHSYSAGMGKQTNIRLDEAVKAAAEERAKRRGLSLQGYVADLIEADVNQSRAAFMAGAAAFLAAYTDKFEEEIGEDRYPGPPQGLEERAPRDAA